MENRIVLPLYARESLHRFCLYSITCGFLAACDLGALITTSRNVELPTGPPITDVITVFDEALMCLNGRIPADVAFAVSQIRDNTGKSDGGGSSLVTLGAGDMVQSALYRAGIQVINRRDSEIMVTEANWGIRDIRRQTPVNFYISGSINSLDFIPGGGVSATVSGIGPRIRQNRILMGLDLVISDAFSGQVVGSVSLQKQIFTREFGLSLGTFFDDILMTGDAGYIEREALHFSLRQMLNLASFELLSQIMEPAAFAPCQQKIAEYSGLLGDSGLERTRPDGPAPALAVSTPERMPAVATPNAGVQQQSATASVPQYELLRQNATRLAARAITAARASEAAGTRREAAQKAAESLQLANAALQRLQEAAAAGLDGDDGDVAAVVIQQAIQDSRAAASAASGRDADRDDVDEQQKPEGEAASGSPSPSAPVIVTE